MKIFQKASVSNRIRLILLIALVLASSATFITAMSIGRHHLNHLFDDKVNDLFNSIENELQIFDFVLSNIEAEWSRELEQNLPALARDFASGKYSSTELDPEALKKIALSHGFTDIYLINEKLIVTAASFTPDIGMDMSKFSDEYTAYLRRLLNKGELGIDRINVSSETGQLKKYAYYSHPGSNLILNADIGVIERIQNEQNDNLAKFLYEDFAKRLIESHTDVIDIDVYNISRADQWSLIRQGEKLSRQLADQLLQGKSVTIKDSGRLTLFRKAPFSKYEDSGFKVFSKVVIDLGKRQQILLSALVYISLGTFILVLLIWLLSNQLLKQGLTRRFDQLINEMRHIQALGNDRISISGNDEIADIAWAMNEMLERISQQEIEKSYLEDLSQKDSLTQIANRRKLDHILATEVSRVNRHNSSLTVLMLDIDFFKEYNDLYGHPAGDKCLKLIAKILGQCIRRPTDLAARYGGEEFICLMPDLNEHDGKEIATKIMDRIKQQKIPHKKSPFDALLTVSLGCLIVDSGRGCSPDQVISQVDQLLYQAKLSGRNQLICGHFRE